MDMIIELAQQIEDNQRMHLESTLPVFASQMAATSFAVQIQDPNKQLIDRLTVNLAQLLEPLAQAQPSYQRQQNCGPPVCYYCRLTGHFFRDCNNPLLLLPAPRNNNNQNNRTINNNILNQRPNHVNINFFGENFLVEATSESASQSEENLFYVFNLINNDYDINELAINISKSTRKKKKAKVDFTLDPNKASKSTVDNNELPKAKVFKNSLKLELPKIVQKFGPYSVVKDLIKTPAHITFGQKDICKSLISKKKTPKTNKCSCQAGLADNSNVTPLICKAQVAGYFINLILDSGLSVSVIAKHFLEAIGRKIDEPSTRPMTNIHSNKKKSLGITKAVPVQINGISIETDMKVSETKEYTIIVGNEWFKKAKALFDYELCELIIRCVSKQNQEKKQSDKSDDNESDEKEDQKKQEETAKLVYTIFTSNDKPLDNVKADKKGIIVNGKLICWPYYNILRRIFDRKPGKKAKYNYCDECKSCLIYYKDWKPISLILREKLKEVQKSFEIVEQKEPSLEERKVNIKNLLNRNSPVISKEGDTPG
ncbi:hypothetical protein G9A89_012756 [Geosiphon pyriformis]|nr:hypothetical protein G9A89_012756 [Geosiphon pyriformis]